MPPTLPLEVGCIFFGGGGSNTLHLEDHPRILKVVNNPGDRNFPK